MGGGVLLAQAGSGVGSLGAVFGLVGLGWAIFVVWWMLTMRTEIQRIRQTVEHGVYEMLSVDTPDHEDEDSAGE